jgi:hypothetical protein
MNEIFLFRKVQRLVFWRPLTPFRLHQLHRLLLEWKLIRSSPSATTTTTAAPTSDLGGSWEIISADEPESRDVYLQRPLPLLPKPTKESLSEGVRSGKGTHDRISHAKPKVASHDRSHRRVKSALGSAPGGSSPLEDYVMDAQTHEMIAIGLSQPQRKERACL